MDIQRGECAYCVKPDTIRAIHPQSLVQILHHAIRRQDECKNSDNAKSTNTVVRWKCCELLFTCTFLCARLVNTVDTNLKELVLINKTIIIKNKVARGSGALQTSLTCRLALKRSTSRPKRPRTQKTFKIKIQVTHPG